MVPAALQQSPPGYLRPGLDGPAVRFPCKMPASAAQTRGDVVRYEGSGPKVAVVLLVVLAGFVLRVGWETSPEAEAQGGIQQPGPTQEPGPL